MKRRKRKHTSRKTQYRDVLKRVRKSHAGREAISRFKRFWKIGTTPTLKEVAGYLPGVPKNGTLVGLGYSPAVTLADGPMGKHQRMVRKTHKMELAANSTGKRMYILTGRLPKKRSRLKFVGYAPQTEYLPYKGVEAAGSDKSRTWWKHEHSEDGGKWPKVYKDSAGNFIYAPGTYSVGRWIRR